MKDPDWSWTLLGAGLVSLESLDMVFDVKNAKTWPIYSPVIKVSSFGVTPSLSR